MLCSLNSFEVYGNRELGTLDSTKASDSLSDQELLYNSLYLDIYGSHRRGAMIYYERVLLFYPVVDDKLFIEPFANIGFDVFGGGIKEGGPPIVPINIGMRVGLGGVDGVALETSTGMVYGEITGTSQGGIGWYDKVETFDYPIALGLTIRTGYFIFKIYGASIINGAETMNHTLGFLYRWEVIEHICEK